MMRRIRLHLVLMLATATLTSASEASKPLQPQGIVLEKIVNGTTSVTFASVVALVANNSQFCTGTLIGCDTVLTAAHCVCSSTGANCQPGGPDLMSAGFIEVFAQHGGFYQVSSIAVPPHYAFGSAGDVAVLKLSTTVRGIAPTPINTSQAPGTGIVGTITGFGVTDGSASDAGMKRTGQVVSASCATVPESSHVCWNFTAPLGAPGDDSNTCSGDSGGPLFMNLGAGTTVVGVTSGGLQADCQPDDSSFGTDVFVERAWIQAQAGGDLSNRICGGLQQAGTSGAIINFAEDSLDEVNTQDFWSLQVSSDVKVLRVLLNGEEGLDNDFDLYVRRVAVPSTSAHDCRGIRFGMYEECLFVAPPAATWHFLVDRFQGSGNYQLIVMAYESIPGSVLYAVGNGSSSTVHKINGYDSLALAEVVGDAGVSLLDIGIDPTTGLIYGVNGTSFYQLSALTGSASFVGSTGGAQLRALEFDIKGQAYGWGPSGDLYKVNKATGAATTVGSTGFTSGGDLAFDAAGTLYGTTTGDFINSSRLIRIDTVTGAGTLIGSLGFSGAFGLEIDSNDTMYVGRGDIGGSTLSEIYLVNKQSGVTALINEIRNHLIGMNGLAFVDTPVITSIFADGFESGDTSAWK